MVIAIKAPGAKRPTGATLAEYMVDLNLVVTHNAWT